MSISGTGNIGDKAAQSMARLITEKQQQFPELAVPATAKQLTRFASDLATSIVNREDASTALAQHLLADLATQNIPSEALTSLNEAFCKDLIGLVTAMEEGTVRLRLVRQVTHAQISVRMVITNAHLQNLLAQRRHS